MKNTLFIIISDIHANEKNSDEINNRLNELAGWVDRKCSAEKYDEVIILVTGDIAFSGKKCEYDIISESFLKLADSCKILLSPGNHDHNFSTYKGQAREILIANNSELDESVINIVTSGQKEYFDFEREVCNVQVKHSTLLSKKYEISTKISIQSLNTAWCSKIKEKGGELTYPIEQIIDTYDNEELRVLFFHHPLSWFTPENNKEIRNKTAELFNIIISGHEHIENSFKVESDVNTNLIIETCSFHDASLEQNGFICFYQNCDDIYIEKHIWNNGSYEKIETKTRNDIVESNAKYSNGFKVKADYYANLTDAGTGFSHPEINELKIDDIFTYQNINNLSKRNAGAIQSESSRDILSTYNDSHIILSGEESTGKTTLLRKLCLDTLENGGFSVFIDGSEIRRSDRYKISTLEEKIKSQYENFTFDQLLKSKNERVIFIDNFDLIRGDSKSTEKIIELLERYFTKIVITISDSYNISQNNIKGDSIFQEKFISLEILKMGHLLRWELIKKWNNLKSECAESDQALIIKTDKAYKEISRVIGKNYIPSTPFFLLTMLQSMDTSISSDLNTSSYGHYYHYLITCSLGISGVDKDKLDGIFTYITEMAFFYHKSEQAELSRDILWDFNSHINKEYTLKIDCDHRLNQLINAKILKENNGHYSFRYPYIFYYFLSKYLSDNMGDEEIKLIIFELIKNLDKTRNMSTLMFLTHHSKDMNILDGIIGQSAKLFQEYKSADLDQGVSFLNGIVENLNLGDLTFIDGDIHTNRQDIENEKDLYSSNAEYHDSDDEIENNNFVDDKSDIYKFIRDFNLTFKSVDLLGQLTRNYHESLKTAPKLKLLTEAIEAPLRALEAIFSLMRNDPDTLLDMLRSRLKDEFELDNHSNDEIEVIARRMLFNLMKGVSFAIIKKISSAIGSRELLPVINLIHNGESKSNALRLIELSVQLDLGGLGSIEAIAKMAKDFKLNTISGALLQDLIRYYLYMFKENTNNKKSVCSILKIKYNPNVNDLQKKLTHASTQE